ncbi:MAG: DNA primase [Oscillospiraceae bacterium]
MLPESFISQLKFACDIEQIISPYTRLVRKGKNMVGLCPFHSEKSPSFFVYPESSSYYCFGCGAGGDIITFVMAAENLEYIEAVKLLAQRAGLSMPENDSDYAESKLKARVLEINREAARYYHQTLIGDEGKAAYSYFIGRGLSPKTIRRFGLGYSPDNWDGVIKYLTEKGYYMKELEASGIVVKSSKPNKNGKDFYFDRFRARAIFPIIDIRGNVIAFGGRAMDNKGAKYINSSDTPVFKKSRNLFALNIAKQTKRDTLILCEGYMDVISVHQGGFDNAVATLGTALTEEQARLIAKYTQKVILAYDSDKAGQAATNRAMQIFEKTGITVNVLNLYDAKDPDEFLKKYGSERFDMLLTGSSNAVQFQINKLKQKYDLTQDDGKVSFLKEFSVLMAELTNPIEREVYTSKIAEQLGVNKQAIDLQTEKISKATRKKEAGKQRRDTKVYIGELPSFKQDTGRSNNLKAAIAEERIIAALYKNPDYITKLQKQITPQQFSVPSNKAIYTVLTDRLQQNQPAELIHLSSVLNAEQMAKLSGLIASVADVNQSEEELQDYIGIIKDTQSLKTESQVAQMDDEQLKKYIEQLAAKKK